VKAVAEGLAPPRGQGRASPAPGASPERRHYPKYYLVKGHLSEMLSGLAPGEALPPERALAERFATSRTTVRQALRELTIEGHLVSVQGSGTFAATPKVAQPLELTSYTEDMRRQGLAPRSRLLSVGYLRADDELARRLGLHRGARALRIERLRMASDEPMAIETTHLAAARFPGLARRLDDSTSLYSLLADVYGVQLCEAEETIETVPAPPREAALLETTVGYPMLLLSRHSRDSQGRPIEYVQSFYRGDRYKFVAQLRRPGGAEGAQVPGAPARRTAAGRRPAS